MATGIKTHRLTVTPSRRSFIIKGWFWTAGMVIITLLLVSFAWNQTRSIAESGGSVYHAAAPSHTLEVHFLAVGQGDCTFIKTPRGRTILIDAGPGEGEYSTFDAGKRIVVPFLKSMGVTHLDLMMLTHPHADHYGGMDAVLDAIEVDEYADSGLDYPSFAYESLLKKIRAKGINYNILTEPAVLDWDPDILVQTLWPETNPRRPSDPNNNSIVTRIAFGQVVYLITGDIESVVETELLAYGPQLRTTILKIPHHGSDSSSIRSFLELMAPRVAVFSLGLNNRFNHPSQSVVDRYREMGISTYRTDFNGTIRTICDGHTVRIKPQNGQPVTVYPFPDTPPGNNP